MIVSFVNDNDLKQAMKNRKFRKLKPRSVPVVFYRIVPDGVTVSIDFFDKTYVKAIKENGGDYREILFYLLKTFCLAVDKESYSRFAESDITLVTKDLLPEIEKAERNFKMKHKKAALKKSRTSGDILAAFTDQNDQVLPVPKQFKIKE